MGICLKRIGLSSSHGEADHIVVQQYCVPIETVMGIMSEAYRSLIKPLRS